MRAIVKQVQFLGKSWQETALEGKEMARAFGPGFAVKLSAANQFTMAKMAKVATAIQEAIFEKLTDEHTYFVKDEHTLRMLQLMRYPYSNHYIQSPHDESEPGFRPGHDTLWGDQGARHAAGAFYTGTESHTKYTSRGPVPDKWRQGITGGLGAKGGQWYSSEGYYRPASYSARSYNYTVSDPRRPLNQRRGVKRKWTEGKRTGMIGANQVDLIESMGHSLDLIHIQHGRHGNAKSIFDDMRMVVEDDETKELKRYITFGDSANRQVWIWLKFGTSRMIARDIERKIKDDFEPTFRKMVREEFRHSCIEAWAL